ncbi:hypothetical protein KEJ18_06315, partial [Candidatus Bathyarchaeota archaeon]|nr:hypothetical protein [Candidatus Bathyarchaeota archaeon]
MVVRNINARKDVREKFIPPQKGRRYDAPMSSDEVTIDVRLVNLAGALMEGTRKDDVKPEFDVNVKLEETERGTGEASFSFALAINTKPNIAKYDITGTVIVTGGNEVVEKLLQINPDTKVPNLLERVYERVFTSVYLLSTLISAPPP